MTHDVDWKYYYLMNQVLDLIDKQRNQTYKDIVEAFSSRDRVIEEGFKILIEKICEDRKQIEDLWKVVDQQNQSIRRLQRCIEQKNKAEPTALPDDTDDAIN